MTQTIYDALQGNTNDEDDLFQCGKCKKQFYSLGSFMVHKRTHQLGNISAGQKTLTETLTNDASNEPDLQLQPIVLSESDILSFSIGQAGLNFSPDQGYQVFEESEELIIPEVEEAQLKESQESTGSFELRSTQIILTTQITNEDAEPMERLLLAEPGSEADPAYSLDEPIHYLNNDSLIEKENDNQEKKNGLLLLFEDQEQNKDADEQSKKIKDSKLKCPYCSKQFSKNFDLQQHMRCHTGERPFQCVVCGRSFTQKSNVKKHMATHKVWPQKIRTLPEKPIQKIATEESGEAMVVDESFACQYCPAAFSSFTQLKSHRKTHANSKIFKCVQKKCGAVFETLDQFLEHTAAHQSEQDTQYTCCHCRRRFTTLDELGNHQRMHGPCFKKKLSVVTCKLCKSKFSTTEALERHQADDPHSYACPECDKVYVCERHLRRHLVSHSSLPSHSCPECGKTFKTAQNLSVHRLIHSSEKPFVCKFCNAAFIRQDRLIRHMFIHDPNRWYKCPFNKHLGCKKEFYRKDKLKQHMLTHSVSKNLKCKRCSRVFKRSSQLKQHETVCLSEDKPCKDCGHITTSLDHYKKNSGRTKESHTNRWKHRLLENAMHASQQGDSVPTIQVVVVPLSIPSSVVLADGTQTTGAAADTA